MLILLLPLLTHSEPIADPLTLLPQLLLILPTMGNLLPLNEHTSREMHQLLLQNSNNLSIGNTKIPLTKNSTNLVPYTRITDITLSRCTSDLLFTLKAHLTSLTAIQICSGTIASIQMCVV